MNELPLKLAVRGQLASEEAKDLARRIRSEERGEMGSWLILAAGLAAAAVAAVGLLATWFNTKVTAITAN
jgi:hypothetical protein